MKFNILTILFTIMGTSLRSGPIHDAVKYRNTAEVKKIIDKDASLLESKDFYGFTPLHTAAYNNCIRTAKFLIASGANLDSLDNDGCTPLHWSVHNCWGEMVKLLIALGSKLDIKNMYHETPLEFADSNAQGRTTYEISEILRSPYNHPDIIKTRDDNAAIFGQRSLRETLKRKKTTLPQFFMNREAGIQNPTNIRSVIFGRKK